MKVYGAISSSSSSSHAEDAPLLVHTNTHAAADEKKPPFVFKGAVASRKTIALAVAGVAACGAVAIVATTTPGSNGAPAFRLGDALDDAKAGKKDFCSNITRSLSLSRVKRIRFDSTASDVVVASSLLSFTLAP